ncbi:aminotransferase DegT [Bacillus cereus]|nr:aminotransferase DegT [Bacillus cereus]
MIPPTHIMFDNEDITYIQNELKVILETGQLTLGKWTKEFEEKFAKYHHSEESLQYAAAVNSGTSALEILFRIFNLNGREILIPTNTFFATALAAHHVGAHIKYVDTEEGKPWISLNKIKEVISPNTKAIVVVHIGGLIVPDIEEIAMFCRENKIVLIEDSAHAHGSILNGKKAGTFGDASTFSFYPTKIVTSGEGGMILSSDKNVIEEAKLYRDQGKDSFFTNTHGRLGYNWRISEINALIGCTQFEKIDLFIEKRTRIADVYNRALKNDCFKLMDNPNCISNYYKYIIYIKDENIPVTTLKGNLKKRGIALGGEVYATPCHLQPIYKDIYNGLKLNNSNHFANNHICLPISAKLSKHEAEFIIKELINETQNLLSKEPI